MRDGQSREPAVAVLNHMRSDGLFLPCLMLMAGSGLSGLHGIQDCSRNLNIDVFYEK
jgi:hypothetical protein